MSMAPRVDLRYTTRNGATLSTPLPRPVSPLGLAPLRAVTPPRRAHTPPSNFYASLVASVARRPPVLAVMWSRGCHPLVPEVERTTTAAPPLSSASIAAAALCQDCGRAHAIVRAQLPTRMPS